MLRLLDALVERAALLVALTISAVVLKTGKGTDPGVPVCVTVDGTTFWQLASLPARVEAHMRGLPFRGARARVGDHLRERRPPAGRRHRRIDQLILTCRILLPMQNLTDEMIARDYETAKKTYALWGVDAEKALHDPRHHPAVPALLAGRRRGRLREPGRAHRRRHPGNGQLPRQGADGRRAARGLRDGLLPHPRPAPREPARHLRGDRRAKVERDALGPEHFAGWISWAKKLGIGLDFNETYFSHPDGGIGLHPFLARQEGAGLLGQALPALPRDRARPWAASWGPPAS